MDIQVNTFQWKLKGFWPYVPMLGKSIELGNDLMGVTDWIDATVPGGVHYDLLRAGLIDDPFFELNSIKCEWVENRWWMYKTFFSIDNSLQNKKLKLIFKGVDYKAHFYLNNEKIGEHEGMFENVFFDITDKVKSNFENELTVLLENAPNEMAQIGHTSMNSTQKSRFNYKWDFSTRMVNVGIWDDVLLQASGLISLQNTFISSGLEKGNGYINLQTEIKGRPSEACLIKITINFEDGNVYSYEETRILNMEECIFDKKFIITNPELWYPNGRGQQPLYKVKIRVFQLDVLSAEEEYFTGIRALGYERNDGSDVNSLPYTFLVNGSPVYIKGVNVVPFDQLYGNVTKETYDKYFYLLKNANINLVRVWGGGIIEKEYFYHLCDLNGIMVWQEFIQSSSGIDNIPSTDPHFLELLKATAIQAVKTKRNHVCHIVWSGGNELTDKDCIPVTYENMNIRMLKEIVNEYDPSKLFLPTSASGPNEFLSIDQIGKNHDVHGSWKFEGIENHYMTFNKSDSLFHSEFGVDGCSSIESLKKVLGEENLKVTNMKDSLVWRHHGEWWDTLERDKEIFENFDSLDKFVKASQFIQAEGLRYALEANRRRQFKNSGSIVWQFNEPWPNVSCTSIVEYRGVPKMAYYFLKAAYAHIHVSLKYEKLFFEPDEEFKCEVYVNNCLNSREIKVVCDILDVYGNLIKKYEDTELRQIPENGVCGVCKIRENIPNQKFGIFFVRLSIIDSKNNLVDKNLYVFSQLRKNIFSPLFELKKARLQVDVEGNNYKLKNIGEEVCLFIHGINSSGDDVIFIENNYTSLFPGEQVTCMLKTANKDRSLFQCQTAIKWDYLNK